MANVAFPSFDDETIWSMKQDQPCSDLMDLFSSVFGQENGSSACDDGMQQQQEYYCKQKQKQKQKMNMNLNVEKQRSPLVVASWDVMGRRKRPTEEEDKEEDEASNMSSSDHRLSMEEILMVAGEKFIQFSTNRVDGISMLIHPYGSCISGLCFEDERDVGIMHSLLSAAEKIELKQFDAAARLVSRFHLMLSQSGSPVQRLAFYFTAALQQKMSKECGVMNAQKKKVVDDNKGLRLALGTNNAFLASHQQLPFGQVAQFAGMQAIIEQVRGGRKLHLIDLQIRSGIHWTVLMQGLADCCPPLLLQHLKITAVGTADQTYMEETGSRLQSFAHSLNLPFVFEAVYLQEMDAFSEDLFKIEGDETGAVYSFMMLRSMISKPECLETVMRAVARIRPVVMVVSEVEANHNCPSFIDRFTEALLFYSAYFDCLEDCMDRCNEYRAILEGHFLGEGIINIVAADDGERVTRNVKLSVWRKYFTRFGMREMELSESSKYQATLVLDQFSKAKKSCNLQFDGKALIVGWKGTPIQSLTAWSFS